MKIVFSIAVHEAPEVLVDQINNFNKYIHDPIIVVHISLASYKSFPIGELEQIKGVYVNPEHLETGWGKIIHAHISNFNYISRIMCFDYFVLHASNDCYIRTGLENYMKNYKAGFNRRKVDATTMWAMGQLAAQDSNLQKISKTNGKRQIVASQIEGSFYCYSLMKEIVDFMEKNYEYIDGLDYTREEFYFSTIASDLVVDHQVGYPVVFSGIHRIDRVYYKYYKFTRLLMKKDTGFRRWLDEKMWGLLSYAHVDRIRKVEVRAIRRQMLKPLKGNIYMDDGIGVFRLYDPKGLFAVKRVPRTLDAKLRVYINRLPKEET